MGKINWDEQPLGRVTDRKLAKKLGVSHQAVQQQRLKRDIPRCRWQDKVKSLVGMRFGKLIVLELQSKRLKDIYPQWLCRCDCGKEVTVQGSSLNYGVTKSCGCLHAERVKELQLIDLTGKRFGRLEVLELWPVRDKHKNRKWLCRCDCGELTVVYGINLKRGTAQSCGCLRRGLKYKKEKSNV